MRSSECYRTWTPLEGRHGLFVRLKFLLAAPLSRLGKVFDDGCLCYCGDGSVYCRALRCGFYASRRICARRLIGATARGLCVRVCVCVCVCVFDYFVEIWANQFVLVDQRERSVVVVKVAFAGSCVGCRRIPGAGQHTRAGLSVSRSLETGRGVPARRVRVRVHACMRACR